METEIRNMLRERSGDVGLSSAIPSATVQRARQRRVVHSIAALATAAALVVGVVAGVNALRGTGQVGFVGPTIEAKKRTELPVPGSPAEIAFGFGSVWVEGQDEIVRIDQKTNEEIARIRPVSETRTTGPGSTEYDGYTLGAGGLAAGEGSVWVTATGTRYTGFSMTASPLGGPTSGGIATLVPSGRSGASFTATFGASASAGAGPQGSPSPGPRPTGSPDPFALLDWHLLRIDPKTNTLRGAEAVSGPRPVAITTSPGAVWVAGGSGPTTQGAVYRFSSRTGELVETIAMGGPVTGIGYLDGFVWASVDVNRADGRGLVQIDPRNNDVVKQIPFRGAIATQDLVVSGHTVWVTTLYGGDRDNGIVRFDTGSRALLPLIPVEHLIPQTLAIGQNAVWMSAQDDDQLYRFDPSVNEFTGRLAAGGHPEDLVAAGNSVWMIVGLGGPSGGAASDEWSFVRFDI